MFSELSFIVSFADIEAVIAASTFYLLSLNVYFNWRYDI